MYLGQDVDKFNNYHVSSFVTAGGAKFMLLHMTKLNNLAIKSYFGDVYGYYVKILMNPFYVK